MLRSHCNGDLNIVKSAGVDGLKAREKPLRGRGGPRAVRNPDSPRGRARAYHHGELRSALIAAAERLIAEQGLEGFSLRECAKMVDVSPAAPAHHFGNAAGLLEAMATEGFVDLAKRMAEALRGLDDAPPSKRISAMARAYVAFAVDRPGCFRVTFGRTIRPSATENAALLDASEEAFAMLLREASRLDAHDEKADAALQRALVIWSFVHGLANLLIDQRMNFLIKKKSDAEDLDRLIAPILGEFELNLSARASSP